jgi:hypothetical protein
MSERHEYSPDVDVEQFYSNSLFHNKTAVGDVMNVAVVQLDTNRRNCYLLALDFVIVATKANTVRPPLEQAPDERDPALTLTAWGDPALALTAWPGSRFKWVPRHVHNHVEECRRVCRDFVLLQLWRIADEMTVLDDAALPHL